MVILATGGYGRAYFSATSGPHLHRRRRRDGAAGRAAAAGHGIRPVPPDRDLRRRLPDHRGRPGRGRLSDQLGGRAVHGALCADREGPGAARHGLPGDDHRDPRRPRRAVRTRTTSTCTWITWIRRFWPSACRGSSETPRRSSPGSTSPRSRSLSLPTVHYNMGGIPTNYHGEVVTRRGRQSGQGRPRPDGRRRGRLRVGARRQPPGLQLADRPGGVRSRSAALRCADIDQGRGDQAAGTEGR